MPPNTTDPVAAKSGGSSAATVADDLTFVRGRIRRLVPPVLPLLAIALAVVLGAAALDRPDVVRGVVLMITPLWFLATYLVLVLLAPLARRVHRSCGLWAIPTGAVLVAVVDRLARAGHLEGVVPMLAEYVLVWAVVHQLGFHLASLRAAPLAARWATCLGGFSLLALGVVWLGYPPSMVGTHTDPISNMSPPNLMVVFLAVAQMGLLAVADGPLRRTTGRHRELLGTAGTWSMTVYVWHMLALAAFWGVAVVVTGTVHHHVDGTWWAQRPVWLGGPLVFAVPLFALTRPGRVRRGAERTADHLGVGAPDRGAGRAA